MPKLKEELQKAVRQVANFDKLKNQIEMTVTSEGLRIELLESSSGTFFESGKPGLNGDGEEVLVALARATGEASEPHLDRGPHRRETLRREPGLRQLGTLYGPGEFGARSLCRLPACASDQISQVRGYADQKLRVPGNPLEPSNRRISLIVQYVVKDDDERASSDAKPEAEPESKAGSESAEKSKVNRIESQH